MAVRAFLTLAICLKCLRFHLLTVDVGVSGQVVVQARGVRGLGRDPRDPLDEVVKGSRPFEAVREDPDARCAEFFGVRGLKPMSPCRAVSGSRLGS